MNIQNHLDQLDVAEVNITLLMLVQNRALHSLTSTELKKEVHDYSQDICGYAFEKITEDEAKEVIESSEQEPVLVGEWFYSGDDRYYITESIAANWEALNQLDSDRQYQISSIADHVKWLFVTQKLHELNKRDEN